MGFPPDWSDRDIPAVDEEIAAGNKARRVAGEKQRSCIDLVRPAETPQQMLGAEGLPTRLKDARNAAMFSASPPLPGKAR